MTLPTMTSVTLMCVLQHLARHRCVNATPCQKFQMPTALGYSISDNIFYECVIVKVTVKIQLG